MLDTNDKNSILKIIDFGCSKILKEDETLSDLIGTVYIYIYIYIAFIFCSRGNQRRI